MVIFERDNKVEDRRDYMRFNIQVKAVYQSDSGAKCFGKTVNISSSGLLLDVTKSQEADELVPGDVGSVAIMSEMDGKLVPLVLKCKMVHVGGNGMGLYFKDNNINTMAMLEQFMMNSL